MQSLNARVGFGVFSTRSYPGGLFHRLAVSMPVWALGSFLQEVKMRIQLHEDQNGLNARVGFGVFSTSGNSLVETFDGLTVSQCPCGLWGLFYYTWDTNDDGTPDQTVSMPVWALGSFLPGRVCALAYFETLTSQCPCGLWGLFY